MLRATSSGRLNVLGGGGEKNVLRPHAPRELEEFPFEEAKDTSPPPSHSFCLFLIGEPRISVRLWNEYRVFVAMRIILIYLIATIFGIFEFDTFAV